MKVENKTFVFGGNGGQNETHIAKGWPEKYYQDCQVGGFSACK